MVKKVLTKVLGDPKAKKLKELQKRVDKINALSDDVKKMTDQQLKDKTAEFKKQLADGKSLDDILDEAFAVVREVSERVLQMRPFDVQLIGGIVLHEGSVAEMKTGEGKTLAATLPVYLNGLEGKGVHVVTVNDYLAQRDAGWMAGIYDFLGLSVSVIIPDQSYIYDPEYVNDEHDDERFKHLKPVERTEAYQADITYGTNNEFGFDYLRDNMVREVDQLRQRELNFAIVDEVDSILIDEARTPLIISAPSTSSASMYSQFAQVARRLSEEDYEKDEKRRAVSLNDGGVEKIQQWLNIDNLYGPEHVRDIYHLDQALKAETLFKKDKDYIVSEDGEVIIVDEFTGRLMHGRRYNEGLHQAIEAKEGVEVLQESMTLATISFQNYFRLYKKLSGMTGTALTEEEEFQQIYDLDVYAIPTNVPVIRSDLPDQIYKTKAGKFDALAAKVKELHEKGQPVLIGTSSIENNDLVSKLLQKAGVPHNVLNAKNNESEAAIVAEAGQKGSVTIATNIAGRGTDIKLGEGVVDLGGLYVVGSERHESRRIDNQLRGRSGRQGDDGATQFLVSAEDDLMRIFGGERISGLMERMGVDETTPIENKALSKALEQAQKKVESHNFDTRKHVVQYDDVMNRHRKAIYTLRRKILESENVKDLVEEMIEGEAARFTPTEDDKIKDLAKEVQTVFAFEPEVVSKLGKSKKESLVKDIEDAAKKRHQNREKQFGIEAMRRLEREVYLQVLDTLWMQHLESMEHLREGITWRAVGQKDPLVEYRREAKTFYAELEATMQTEVIRSIFYAIPAEDEIEEPLETELTKAAESSQVAQARETKKRSEEKASAKEPALVTADDSVERDRIHQKKRQQTKKKKKQARKNRKKGRRK